MKYFQLILLTIIASLTQFSYGQLTTINGLVKAKNTVENIHVINKTSKQFTTTTKNGSFVIPVKENDTLLFSGVQYKLESIIISKAIIKEKELIVFLEDYVNTLDEVVIGKVLTGYINSDINNAGDKKKLDFYDVGIPGYKGKPLTKSERLLKEAGEFKPSLLLGVSIPLNPIINTITGRTKKLKNRVKLEQRDNLLHSIKIRFSEILFANHSLQTHQKTDYFYFVSEDKNFETICKNKNDLTILNFLQKKLINYKINLKN